MPLPNITFGIIVLNGEPFTRYNLRALYPFAYQIIVVEGASPKATHISTPDGHSIDGTLEIVKKFKAEEDPGDKVIIITAEAEGYPDGFWPGEKDEQSQAYAKRATGNWLWQVDIDEFYQPEDMQRASDWLVTHPQTTCLTFNAFHFWGGFNYLLEGGLFMRKAFQGESWGAYRRVFKWEPGYKYVTHRPPTVLNKQGEDITQISKCNLTTHFDQPIYIYHYTSVFPSQVIPKGKYYSNQGWKVGISQKKRFEDFSKPIDWKKALRIHNHYRTYNWLRRFCGEHPPTINILRQDLEHGFFNIEVRPVDDMEKVLKSWKYNLITDFCLYPLEYTRSFFSHIYFPIHYSLRNLFKKFVRNFMPLALTALFPKTVRLRLRNLKASKS